MEGAPGETATCKNLGYLSLQIVSKCNLSIEFDTHMPTFLNLKTGLAG